MKKRKISVLIAGLFLSISSLGAASCGKGNDNPTPPTPEHVHNLSEWKHDETNHWHTCDGCDEILDKAAHTFGEWVETKAATCTEKGEKSKKCSVCKYVHKEETPVLGHKVKETWETDATNHWHTCETCGETLDKAEHSYGDWVVTKAATCTENGEKTKTCTVCNYVVKETIPMLGHKPKTTWDADDTNHWHACETCGEALDKAEHTFGDWEVKQEPTCSNVGKKAKTCSICGHVIEEEIPINPENHEFGTYQVTKEPTTTEEGKIVVSCKHNVEHTQEIILPVLASHIYQLRQADKDENTYDSYYCFNPNNREGIDAIFADTWMKGTDQLAKFIAESTFGHKDVCKHVSFVAEYVKHPTNSSEGKIKVYCEHCNESEIVTIPIGSLKDYNCVPSKTEAGQATYNLNLAPSNNLYESSNLKTKFPTSKLKIVKAIKAAEFKAPLYNLHIEPATNLHDPTQPIILKVFIPREITLPQYIEVNTHLVWRSDEWLNYVYEPGADCSEPIKKSVYFKEDMALKLAQEYLDPECGMVSIHPDIVSELTNICLGSDMEVTPEEQSEHSRHKLGKIELLEAPSSWGDGLPGKVRAYCANESKCKYYHDFSIPKFDDTNFYETTGTITVSYHKVKDSAINTTINDVLKEKFIYTLDETFRQKFRDLLDFTIHKGIAVSNARPISDKSDGFALQLHVDGRPYKSVEADFTRYDTQYFTFGYWEHKCHDFQKQYFLNEAGVNRFMSLLEPELQENPHLRKLLMDNYRVGMVTPTPAEIAANKKTNHEFVYYYHDLPSGTTERNGHICAICSSCREPFRMDISNNDIYTNDGGQQVINQQAFENRIKEVFPAFTAHEVRAYAEVFILGNYF